MVTTKNLITNFDNSITETLKRKELSITDTRKKILEFFYKKDGAISHSDIEKNNSIKFDRVTIYRTLQTFLEKGIIHTIPTSESNTLFALCKNNCGNGHHHDNHVHFICSQCKNTTCLDDVFVPKVPLPKGFKVLTTNMNVNGICKNCA